VTSDAIATRNRLPHGDSHSKTKWDPCSGSKNSVVMDLSFQEEPTTNNQKKTIHHIASIDMGQVNTRRPKHVSPRYCKI
jgi:hypothetical protein